MLLVERPPAPQYGPRPAADQDVAVLMFSESERMRTTTALGAYAGLRVSEAAALRWEEITLSASQPELHVVHGKGDRFRTVPILRPLLEQLEQIEQTTGPVVRSFHDGGAITGAGLGHWLERHYAAEGVDITFHQLRHYFASKVQEHGGDLLLTQTLMGHASPATTVIYAKVPEKAIRELEHSWFH